LEKLNSFATSPGFLIQIKAQIEKCESWKDYIVVFIGSEEMKCKLHTGHRIVKIINNQCKRRFDYFITTSDAIRADTTNLQPVDRKTMEADIKSRRVPKNNFREAEITIYGICLPYYEIVYYLQGSFDCKSNLLSRNATVYFEKMSDAKLCCSFGKLVIGGVVYSDFKVVDVVNGRKIVDMNENLLNVSVGGNLANPTPNVDSKTNPNVIAAKPNPNVIAAKPTPNIAPKPNPNVTPKPNPNIAPKPNPNVIAPKSTPNIDSKTNQADVLGNVVNNPVPSVVGNVPNVAPANSNPKTAPSLENVVHSEPVVNNDVTPKVHQFSDYIKYWNTKDFKREFNGLQKEHRSLELVLKEKNSEIEKFEEHKSSATN